MGAARAAEKLMPYQDYLFVIVHGVNDYRYSFIGESPELDAEKNTRRNLKQMLRDRLGIADHYVHAYSYTRNRGSNIQNAKEFGKRGYRAPLGKDSLPTEYWKYGDAVGGLLRQIDGESAPYVAYSADRQRDEYWSYMPSLDKYFPTGVEPGNSWLEQAQKDWKIWYLGSADNFRVLPNGNLEQIIQKLDDPRLEKLVPKKYVLMAHSMGGVSTRLYIYSNEMAASGDNAFDKGFYEDDVAKVVFINPPLKGSDAAWVLVCVGVPLS